MLRCAVPYYCAVQAPAEKLTDALKDTLVLGKDTLVAGVMIPAHQIQKVFQKIAGAARSGGNSNN